MAETRPARSAWAISPSERVIVILVLALVGGVYLWGAQYWIDPFEEGYFAYLASRVAQGDHPYRDFATPYTPAFFYLHALIFKIFGYSLFWQRASVIAARVVGAGLLYLLARRAAPPRYAVLAPVTFLLLDPAPVPWQTHPSWYAAPCATGAALAMLRYLDSRRWLWLGAAGGAAAVSFAFKQNVGLLTLLALISFAALTCPLPWRIPTRFERLGSTLDATLPRWISMLPALGSVVLMPLALTVALRARPFLEYGLEYVLPLLLVNAWLYFQHVPNRDNAARSTFCVALILGGFIVVTVPWTAALMLAITRHEVPLRQFLGGVDPAGYILDQWWPRPAGQITLFAAPALVASCWDCVHRRYVRALGWGLGVFALFAYSASLIRVPGTSTLAAITDFTMLSTENINQLLPAAAAGLVVLACLGGWVKSGEERTVGWLLTFGAATFFLQYPRMDEPHLIFSFPPMMAALAWFLARLEGRIVGGVAGEVGAAARLAIALSLVFLPLVSLFPVTNWRWSMLIPPRGDSLFPVPHAYVRIENPRANVLMLPYIAQPLDLVANELTERTSPGEAIFVFPAAPMLYYLADRSNATKYNHFLPGLASLEEEHGAIYEIQERSVRVVVLEPAFEYLWLRETDYAELRWFLRSEFERSAQIGPYEIWTRE